MQNNEKIVETKSCKHCEIKFEITDKDLEFYEKVSPVFGDRKYSIPTPTLCPDCRQQRRLSFYNDKKLYKRKCHATGRDTISMYSPDSNYNIYSQKEWWSDGWDQLNFGRDFDFSKSFFKQFSELLKKTPLSCLNSTYTSLVNSDYNNACGHLKDCYLLFQADYNEDSLYGVGINNSKYVINSLRCNNLEKGYECIDCNDSYGLFFCKDVNNCSESYFLKNCEGCKKCFLCSNIINKSYCFKNIQYSKEEYNKILEQNLCFFDTNKINNFKKDLNNLQLPNKNLHIINSEFSTGDYLLNTKQSFHCYESINLEESKYCSNVLNTKKCYDIDQFGFDLELNYEGLVVGKGSYKNAFSVMLYGGVSEVYYSYLCLGNSSYLFGCAGLRDKSYCIFNKQYTKEEYNILVPKIIEHMQKTGEWGEFFPSAISPFGYNETVAQEYFPLSPPLSSEHLPLAGEKNQNSPPARSRGIELCSRERCPGVEGLVVGEIFNWSDYEPPKPNVEKIIPAEKLPENIADIPDDILNWAIECEITKKPYRIIKPELEFYRKHNLPIPRRHPDQRHLDRMKLRNPRKLFERDCDKCGENMKTTYAPERKEIVYCEKCYEKEVY